MTDLDRPKLPRRRFRFSLRTLLVSIALLSLPLSWIGWNMRQAARQRESVEEIRKEAGFESIRYDWQYTSGPDGGWRIPWPNWLRKQLGDDFFYRVVYVRSLKTNAGLAHLENLQHLRELDLWTYDSEVTDAGLQHIKGLSQLEVLSLRATKATDAGLEHLRGLSRLRTLNLSQTQFAGTGFQHLKGLKQLRDLDLSRTLVSDVGLAHLKELKQLESLNLWATQVTDAGLEHLHGLDQLRSFDVNVNVVTNAGLLKLQ
ncbi:MAG: leucine-rich repeat domain-containing protein [Pirellulales bacterium]